MRRLLLDLYGGEKIACWLSGLKHALVEMGIFSTNRNLLGYPLTPGCRRAVSNALFQQHNAKGLVELARGEKDASLKRDIVQKLEGIYVRSYSFDHEGEYDRAVLDKVRAQLGPSWKKIVNVRSRHRENAEIYIATRGGGPYSLDRLRRRP